VFGTLTPVGTSERGEVIWCVGCYSCSTNSDVMNLYCITLAPLLVLCLLLIMPICFSDCVSVSFYSICIAVYAQFMHSYFVMKISSKILAAEMSGVITVNVFIGSILDNCEQIIR